MVTNLKFQRKVKMHKSIYVIFLTLFILFPSLCMSSEEIIKGHYCYTYGDKESLKEAKDLTRTLAVRNAIESYRVYIESTTTVRNFTLTNDIVQIVSSGYLKKMRVVDHSEEGRTICDTVEFTVSPQDVEKVIKREIGRRTQKIEEKGIDNNGYIKIISVTEGEPKKNKDGDEYRSIHVRAKILRKVDRSDDHLMIFMTKYNSEGEEISTDRERIFFLRPYEISVLYPGEVVEYYGFEKWESTKSYKIWLYDEKNVNDISESKTPMRKNKRNP